MVEKNGGRMNGEYISAGTECFANSGDTLMVGESKIIISMESKG